MSMHARSPSRQSMSRVNSAPTLTKRAGPHWLPEEFRCRQRRSVEEARRRAEEAYFASLHATFQLRGYIKTTERRGITLSQLRAVVEFAKQHCEAWHDTAPLMHSATSGEVLHIGILNLYHVNAWLIKPANKQANCAFVELVAACEQPPHWFISHWWGEVVKDFLRCVECHANTRCLQEATCFWVCAYANRQHSLQGDINDNPKQTSFFKAMQLANFQVLLILDTQTAFTGPATPFSRIWCAFEESMCLDQACTATLDVATTCRSRVDLITQGLTADEEALERMDPGSGFKAKVARECTFPLNVVSEGLKFDIRQAQASVEEDRIHILNCICERELNIEPAADHPKYQEANVRLQALFVLAMWRRVMASECLPQSKMSTSEPVARPHSIMSTPGSVASRIDSGTHLIPSELRVALSNVLRADVWRTSLDLSLAGFDDAAGDPEVVLLAQSLPPNLQDVTLDLRALGISDECMGTLGGGLPSRLRAAELDLSGCRSITDHGVASFRTKLRCARQLERFCLRLRNTLVNEDWQERCETLDGFMSIFDEEGEYGEEM